MKPCNNEKYAYINVKQELHEDANPSMNWTASLNLHSYWKTWHNCRTKFDGFSSCLSYNYLKVLEANIIDSNLCLYMLLIINKLDLKQKHEMIAQSMIEMLMIIEA